MALDGREPDGRLWISQDENCGHILRILAQEEGVYEWDFEHRLKFASEDEAMTRQEADCPILKSR